MEQYVTPKDETGKKQRVMPLHIRLFWLLLTICVLVYMLPIILVCGLLGMSITARNRMNAAFELRNRIIDVRLNDGNEKPKSDSEQAK